MVLKNVRVLDPVANADEVRDVQIEGLSGEIDASSMILTPGLRDVHVHFRDPGATEAEDIYSGARCAAAGGFTCVTTMPNTSPAGDNIEWIRDQIENNSIAVRIAPSGCITKGRAGQCVAALEDLRAAGAVAFTDDGSFVDNEQVMREAMERAARLGVPVMQHAVVPSILAGGVIRDCAVAQRFSLKVMPPKAETAAVERDIALCRETGCALHIQHISCAGTVELIRAARKEGLPVTGEATPHHLLLACEDIPDNDANYKMAPPLGNSADRAAIRAGVMDGTLSILATDHAPHPVEKKRGGFAGAANGIIGLETAAAATWQVLVVEEGMSPLEWARRWCVGPAELIHEQPDEVLSLRNVALFDTAANWEVRIEDFKSKSRNQPYVGRRFALRPKLTICEGRLTYER